MVLKSFGIRLKVGNEVKRVKDDCQVSDSSNWWYCGYLANMKYSDDPL